MSEQMEQRSLESAVQLGCGLPEEPHLAVGRCDPNSEMRPGWRPRRKPMNRQGRKRSRSANWSRQGRLEQRNPSPWEILLACEMILSKKTKAHEQGWPLEEEIVAACEMILAIKPRTQEQGLPQEISTAAGLEVSHESGSTTDRKMSNKAEVANPADKSEQNVGGLPREEPEVQTDLLERQRRETTWSVRVVLPRLVGLRLETVGHWLAEVWNWTRTQLVFRQAKKRLRVCETVSLGEKRFVAVIEVDGKQFLVGGASGSVATLARLEPAQEFSEVLKRRWSQDPVQA